MGFKRIWDLLVLKWSHWKPWAKSCTFINLRVPSPHKTEELDQQHFHGSLTDFKNQSKRGAWLVQSVEYMTLFSSFWIYLFICVFIWECVQGVGRGRGRGRRVSNRLHAKCGAWSGALSHDLNIMTHTETNSQTLNLLHHPGTLGFFRYYQIDLQSGHANLHIS